MHGRSNIDAPEQHVLRAADGLLADQNWRAYRRHCARSLRRPSSLSVMPTQPRSRLAGSSGRSTTGVRSLVGAEWGAIVGRHQATWSLLERSIHQPYQASRHNQTHRPTLGISFASRGSGVQIPSAPPRNSRSEAHLQLSSYPQDGSCRHIGRNLGDRVLPERDGIVLSRWHGWPCRPLTTSLFPSVSVAYRTAALRSQRMATND
jgi:hypothetical protein